MLEFKKRIDFQIQHSKCEFENRELLMHRVSKLKRIKTRIRIRVMQILEKRSPLYIGKFCLGHNNKKIIYSGFHTTFVFNPLSCEKRE